MRQLMVVISLALMMVLLLIATVIGIARYRALARYDAAWDDVNTHQIPTPWPLTDEEKDEIQQAHYAFDPTEPDDWGFDRIALDRALTRGEHLVEARLLCGRCHGQDYGGDVAVDVPGVMTLIAPNLTQGEGGVIGMTNREWSLALRHGINRDGTTSLMDCTGFHHLSDQEISDVVSFISREEPVDRKMLKSSLGPVMWLSVGLGAYEFSAERIDHTATNASKPPEAAASVEFGQHLARTACITCHGETLSGGPMQNADPDWPSASNLTQHEQGLMGWTRSQFYDAMRLGKRPDGTRLDPSMPWRQMAEMTDVELDALFVYLKSLPARPTGG